MRFPKMGWRLPLLGLAGLALLTGLWAGLLRMGWAWPRIQPALPMSHGPLMVSGFLGTLILLERAVAIQKAWAYLGVALNGLGGVFVALGAPGPWGAGLMALGSVVLVLIFLFILRQHLVLHTTVMASGAACWLVGNAMRLFGAPVYQVVLWWAAFLVLTVAGERLELSRGTRLAASASRLFLLVCSILIGGLVFMQIIPDLGWRFFGLGLLALSAWLFRFDVAGKTMRTTGLPRFIAWCLLAGYAWLGAAGLAGTIYGPRFAGPYYDLFLHAIFLGFVTSMVFGHAPIILPAILGYNLAYTPIFYLPLALLHSSLLLRVIGDLVGVHSFRLWGGLAGASAILLFLGLAVGAGITAGRRRADR